MRLSAVRRIADALGRLEAAIGSGPGPRSGGAAGLGAAGLGGAVSDEGEVPGGSEAETGEEGWQDRAAAARLGLGRASAVRGGVGRAIFGDLSGRAGTATAVIAGPAPVGDRAGPAGTAGTGVVANSVEGLLQRVDSTVARATARLADAEATTRRLLAALAHVPEGVVIADEHGTIVYRNPQAASFVGARHGEALAERALSELLSAALQGRCSEENLELFSPTRRTLTIRAQPMADSGPALGAVAIIEDVSERRRLEAVRRDFVANISHELKTPVGALSLVAETLEGEDDPTVVARLSHRMRTEAERLGRIIEDLLDLSRIEAEESPSRDPVPAYVVVRQAVDRSRSGADHREIKLEVAEPPRHLVIRGDRRQLVAALHNLVDNAVKYSESGSAVEVSVGYDQEWIELIVADHGIGIPSKDIERIFERFYRVDRARSRDTGGTGLGLAIVRHVASNHGGVVSVESREGDGSTFRLRLPNGTRTASPTGPGLGRDGRRD